MKFFSAVETDVGLVKSTNQDSALIKHALCDGNEILMAIVCDGMGGLEKGELASATVIRAFAKWFDEELAFELEKPDLNVVGAKWSLMLKDINIKILKYAQQNGIQAMGTTFTGILFIGQKYLIVHVGDSRVYYVGEQMRQLTTDQTFVAREIARGAMTPEQAKTDKRRNLLLQCVGASDVVEPQIVVSDAKQGIYMLCSDGFRHEISEEELYGTLRFEKLNSKSDMHSSLRQLIELNKMRKERDNITALAIKALAEENS